jgi:glycosyltransferase involved in cell wall biosynthesis
MAKLKVGIDVSQIIYGTGVSDYTINLVQSLQKLGSELDLTLFGSSLRQQSAIKSIFPATKTYPFPPTLLHYLWNILHVVPIEKFIGKIDVFHTSDWTQPPSKASSVTTVHDLSPILFPQEMGKSIVSAHTSRLKWATKSCKKIICVSQSTANDMEKLFKYPRSNLVVIPEALPSRFDIDVSHTGVEAIKSKWHLDDYVITIGTPQPRKNYPRLINAYLKNQNKYRLPEKLVIIGGGGWGSNIASYPNIIKTGFLPDNDVSALVKGACALVYPSLYEGFGLPILIAWRQGIPVSVSNVSSLPEVAGESAVVFDPYDEESIAVGISESIKNKKSLVTASTKKLFGYNWDITAKKTLEVYKSLC